MISISLVLFAKTKYEPNALTKRWRENRTNKQRAKQNWEKWRKMKTLANISKRVLVQGFRSSIGRMRSRLMFRSLEKVFDSIIFVFIVALFVSDDFFLCVERDNVSAEQKNDEMKMCFGFSFVFARFVLLNFVFVSCFWCVHLFVFFSILATNRFSPFSVF